MILVVGGLAAGKRAFVRTLGYDLTDFSTNPVDNAPVFWALETQNWEDDEAMAAQLATKEVVICQELGCGLVPMDPAQRAHREQVGRMCVRLARQADRVIRVVCGVGTTIKE